MSNVQEALTQTADRVADLLEAVHDPSRRAVGDWTIAETAAHIREVAAVDGFFAAGIAVPDDMRATLDRAAVVSLADVPAMNDEAVVSSGDREPAVIAGWLREHVKDVLANLPESNERVRWVGGLETTRFGVLAHLVSELLMHGRDIATAEKRAFEVPADAASVFFEHFFFDVVSDPQVAEFTRHRAGSLGPVSWTVHMRGAPRVAFEFDGSALTARPEVRGTDLHVRADPAAMLLLMFERMSPARAALSGKVVVYGPRPWRIGRLMRLLKMP